MNMKDELENYTSDLSSKTNDQLNDELAALTLEEKQLDLEIKRQRVAEIRAKQQNLLDQTRAKSMATRQFLAQRAAIQAHCNHRKGGQGVPAVIHGEGTSAMYAVAKHMLPNGLWWVLCTRCGKEWHPENPFNVENGRIVPVKATPGWQEAVNYPTDNTPSRSSTFFIRESTAEAAQ
jgi:hypothetical protein